MMDASTSNEEFLGTFEEFIKENGTTINRQKGFVHPRFPDLIYPINYGYINGTQSQDGQGIDVYQGDDKSLGIVAIICTVDNTKKDSKVKVLYDVPKRTFKLQ